MAKIVFMLVRLYVCVCVCVCVGWIIYICIGCIILIIFFNICICVFIIVHGFVCFLIFEKLKIVIASFMLSFLIYY